MERAQVVARVAAAIDVGRQVVVLLGEAAPEKARQVADRRRQLAQVAEQRQLEEQLARVDPLLDVGEVALEQRLVALLQEPDDMAVDAALPR